MAKKMTFMVAMQDFFGKKEGQNAADFMKEMREACGAAGSPQRDFWIEGLRSNDYEIVSSSL